MRTNIIYNEDCIEGTNRLPDNSIDLLATDPQYGWNFMGKDWDRAVPSIEIWQQCFRVLRPGAFAFIMSGPRQDCLAKMISNLDKTGFNINFTSIYWAYASGFPKAQNIGKVVDKRLGAEREVIRRNPNSRENCDKSNTLYESGTVGKTANITLPATPAAKALDGSYGGFQPKPAIEVVIVAMKPLSEKTYVDQALKNGKGITWLDEGRIPYKSEDMIKAKSRLGKSKATPIIFGNKAGEIDLANAVNSQGRFPANLLCSDDVLNDGTKQSQGHWSKTKTTGYGKFGGGKSEYSGVGRKEPYIYKGRRYKVEGFIKDNSPQAPSNYNDSGSFSRYFSLDTWWEKRLKELPESVRRTFPFLIVSKASKSEKNRGCEGLEVRNSVSNNIGFDETNRNRKPRNCQLKNHHPTVKPIKLMSYLITLGSRQGDIVLDPFIGSGTTAIACQNLGRYFIGFETNKEYCQIAKKRLAEEDTLFNRKKH